ncbi:MAG: orotidine-5'-phosphate decarboxylase [Mariprofundaceae bacterium]
MKERLMVAMDLPDRASTLAMRDKLSLHVSWLKVGLRLFVAEGAPLVHELCKQHKIFLDLKFHDIPNTVAQAVASAGDLGVHMLNVHAAGGPAMLEAASKAAEPFEHMRLIAVTVLTSDPMPKSQAQKIALERAGLAYQAGLDGIVCSVHEVAAIKEAYGNSFITVTPGIRWDKQNHQDQQRVADPAMAARVGSDYIVVGRPILAAGNPAMAANEAIHLLEEGWNTSHA